MYPICTDAKYLPVVLREYGCTRCQTYHREPDPLYREHLVWQSKHSYREVDVYTAITEIAADSQK